MDYEDLISDLKDIIENSKYADFCLRDVHEAIYKYLEEHTLTIAELGDIFFFISQAIEEETEQNLKKDWEDYYNDFD